MRSLRTRHAKTSKKVRRLGLLGACASLLTGCQWQQPTAPPLEIMVGVLTLGAREGQSFHECQLQEPWNCFRSAEPECNFVAVDKVATRLRSIFAEAGVEHQGFATFGIKFVGTRVSGASFGHMGMYPCEVTAHELRSIEEVPSQPPDR